MKKWIALVIIMVMTFSLVACGSTTTSSTQEKTKLILGTSADYPPFEFITLNDNGETEYDGIDISLAQKLAEDKGMELEIVNMSFENLMTALQKGEVDMVIAAISENEERDQVASFSDSYYSDYPPMVLVKKDKLSEYTSLDSFNGKIVGAQVGTTKADIVTNNMPNATLTALSNVTDLVNNLEYNKCDAIVLDGAVAISYASQNDDLAVADVQVGDSTPYAVAVQKGDPNQLLSSFNTTINNAVSTGLVDQWASEADELSEQAVDNN